MRALLLFIVCVTAACHYSPPGSCSASADCGRGMNCSGGVCVGCASAADCEAWEDCSTARRCVSKPGMCGGNGGCVGCEKCAVDHTCVKDAKSCLAETDCEKWQTCGSGQLCLPQLDRCDRSCDCTGWMVCSGDHKCVNPQFEGGGGGGGGSDSGNVLIWGSLGLCDEGAVAPVESPDLAMFGFSCTTLSGTIMLSPAGHLYYTDATGALRRFVDDPLEWNEGSSRWDYPSDPYGDDPVEVESNVCGGSAASDFVMNAGDGTIYYGCGVAPYYVSYDYYDTNGDPQLSNANVYSWSKDDVKLVGDDDTLTAVIDAHGIRTPITGLTSAYFGAIRALNDGFWVSIETSDFKCQRWKVGYDGQATLDGTYAGCGGVMSPSGALFMWHVDEVYNPIIKCPIDSACKQVYSEKDKPSDANDFSAQPFKPYVVKGDWARLVTTP